MPYNTRRKSLSLPSLGIHVPVTHAARAAAAAAAAASRLSPSSSAANSPRTPSLVSPSRDEMHHHHHPSKKLKRAHSEDSDDSELSPEPLPKKRDSTIRFENTPPPSPPADETSSEMDQDGDKLPASSKTIDLESINDEIVEAVVVQLQKTGNRPHLVKELAAILMQQLKIVQQSANPCAIISSRLSTYLKRSCWSATAACPLAKELETVHPRRTYFYLTTCPHQPLPDPAHAAALSQLATRTMISPSVSSAASASEDADLERRRELSPSPEVDLSSPEFDDMDDDLPMPSTPVGSLSMRSFAASAMHMGPHHHHHGHHHGHHHSHHHHHDGAGSGRRAASPPLEKDEKEFTQTADGLQKRKLSGELLSATSFEQSVGAEIDFESRDDSGLFGDKMLSVASVGVTSLSSVASFVVTSPAMPLGLGKRDGEVDGWAKFDQLLEWDRSPENIALEELDCLLDDY